QRPHGGDVAGATRSDIQRAGDRPIRTDAGHRRRAIRERTDLATCRTDRTTGFDAQGAADATVADEHHVGVDPVRTGTGDQHAAGRTGVVSDQGSGALHLAAIADGEDAGAAELADIELDIGRKIRTRTLDDDQARGADTTADAD